MTDTTAGGGGAAAAAAFDGVITSMPPVKNGPYSKERFIQECTMQWFSNTNFNNETNIIQAANNAINRAKHLASMMEFSE